MKKLLLLFVCFIPIISLAQEIDSPYEFPIKPGTEQWAKLNSSREMDSVCIIPSQLLKSLSTNALFTTCLDYPRIIDFFLANDLQSGFNICSKRFNGLTELLKRSNLNQVLLQGYINLDIEKETLNGYEGELSRIQIGFIELLIAQDKVIYMFTKEEKKTLLSEATLNLEKRKDRGESLYRQRTTALIISRILNSQNLNLFEIGENDKDVYSIFNSTGVILDTSIIDRLLAVSKNANK